MPSRNAIYSRDTQARAAFLLIDKLKQQRATESRPPWRPNPGAQTMALFNKAHELLYGGAAGGGKTDLLLGAAATVHFKSIIFRRQFPQLKDIIRRSREIYSVYPTAKYNKQEHVWQLPFGRTLEFGAMPLFDDRDKFQGRPHDGKLFDEITQFDQDQYTYVIGWTRTTRPGQRARSIAAGNPPTNPEGEWIISYWAPWLDKQYDWPAKAGEVRWFATIAGKSVEVENGKPFYSSGQLIEPRSRSYVPARLTDNPYLAHTGYSAVVNAMPEPLRSLLLFGFEAEIPPELDPWQVIPAAFLDVSAAQHTRLNGVHQSPITSIGVDTARGGADRTVIAIKRGNYVEPLYVYAGTETLNGEAAARKVVEAMGLDPDAVSLGTPDGSIASRIPINIDIIGANGSSTYDTLKRAGFNAHAVHPNGPSRKLIRERTLRTQNLRAEMYWIGVRENIDPDYGTGLLIPDDRELRQELAAAKWQLSERGQIMLEPKDKIQARLHRSPDKADAVALATLETEGRGVPPPPPSSSGRTYGNSSVEINPGHKAAFVNGGAPEGMFDPDREVIMIPGIGMVPVDAVHRLGHYLTSNTRFKRNF